MKGRQKGEGIASPSGSQLLQTVCTLLQTTHTHNVTHADMSNKIKLKKNFLDILTVSSAN
jgi:hypothetical protein